MSRLIEQVREELETGSYYVEDYASIKELLEEREWTTQQYNDKITEINHKIVENVPVIIYENPESTLFNVAYVEEHSTFEDIINKLK